MYAPFHPKALILSGRSHGITIRSYVRNNCKHTTFISQIELKSFLDVENDESYIMTMQEELH